nr:hypothetical protein [uncultured bacterium]
MSIESIVEPEADAAPPIRFPRWGFVVGWVVCIAALLPLFYAASWAGSEVGKFQLTTYEAATRNALKEKDFASALEYCDGAIKAGHNHSEHWGRVHTLRSYAYVGMGKVNLAADELIQAGDFFMRRYYYSEQQDRREVPRAAQVLGNLLLQKGDSARALAVLSAGAMASGDPVAFLSDLAANLGPEHKSLLWQGGEPYLFLTPFIDAVEDGPKLIVNEQDRAADAPVLTNAAVLSERKISIDLAASPKEGNCWLGLPAYIGLSKKPFGIRMRIKSSTPPPSLYLSFWFESPQKSATTTQPAGATDADGWTEYDVQREFYKERNEEATANGYSCEGGIINQIGVSVPAGEATQITFQPAQLYLPKA